MTPNQRESLIKAIRMYITPNNLSTSKWNIDGLPKNTDYTTPINLTVFTNNTISDTDKHIQLIELTPEISPTQTHSLSIIQQSTNTHKQIPIHDTETIKNTLKHVLNK